MTDAPPRGSDAGYTLIEVLIAVVILGLIASAIMGAIGAGIITSRVHRSQSTSGTVLVSAIEKIKSTNTSYQLCPDPAANNAAYQAYVTAARTVTPAGWPATSITIPAIGYWDGTNFNTGVANCHDTTDLLKQQLITVLVTSPDNGSATESLSFVKRG